MSDRTTEGRSWLVGGGRRIPLDRHLLIGIVNATPDSFSDGGQYGTVEELVGRALRLVEEGAAIIDVGGASTRPGAPPVTEREEIDRTVGLIEQLRACSSVPISIDTSRARVARAALDAGAVIVNDIAAGLDDPGMLPLAAEHGCGLILMHRRTAPEHEQYSDRYEKPPAYDDVVHDVRRFLLDRCRAAESAGVRRESIVIDPGLGFGKSVEQNLALIGRTSELVATGYAVLGASSRKSFIGAVTGVDLPRERVIGSVVAAIAQLRQGAVLFRVHDVAAHGEALAMITAIEAAANAAPKGEPVA
jgi:dihydropteroate synthase